MVRIEAQKVEIAIASIIAISLLTFTLWILEFPYKYLFYVLQISITVVLFLAVVKMHVNIRIKAKMPLLARALHSEVITSDFLVAFLLIIFSLSIIVNAFKVVAILQLMVAILVASFLPGYVLLVQWRSFQSLSLLERIILSYLTGFSLVAVLTFLLNTVFHNPYWSEIVLLLFVLLGLSSVIKSSLKKLRVHGNVVKNRSFPSLGDTIALTVLLLFFLTATFCLFPNFTLLLGTDISRHQGYAQALVRTPQLRGVPTYLFFDLWLGFLYTISGVDSVLMQTALQILNFIPILAFYVMARKHLQGISRRLPIISTIFWALFSGLGWLYVTNLKLSDYSAQFDILRSATGKTYNSVVFTNGLFIRGNDPTSFTFIFLFIFLSILSRNDLEKKEYLGLYPFLFVSWYFTHRVEFLIFSIFVGLYSLSKIRTKTLQKLLHSSLLGFVGIGIFEFTFPFVFSSLLTHAKYTLMMYCAEIAVVIFVVLSIAFSHIFYRKTLLQRLRNVFSSKAKETSCLLLAFLFLSLFGWMLLAENFSMSMVTPVRNVPWYFYSLLLGVNGFLSVIGIYYWLIDSEKPASLGLFIFFALFAFVFGKLLSILKINSMDLPYFEERIPRLISISTAILAPLFVMQLSVLTSRIQNIRKRLIQTTIVAFLVSVLVLSGTTTTLICSEYGYYQARGNALSDEEQEALKAFRVILEENPYSIVSVISDRSEKLAAFSTAPRILLEWTSMQLVNPASTIYLLSRTPKDWAKIPYEHVQHRYLYLSKEDQDHIRHDLGDTYLSRILPNFPLVFNNSQACIYELPYSTSPLLEADTVLIEPFCMTPQLSNSHLAHAILSLCPCNYTVRYDIDSDIWKKDCLVLSFDPDEGGVSCLHAKTSEDYLDYARSGGRLIVANTNGYGFFSDYLGMNVSGKQTSTELKGLWDIEIPNVTVPITRVDPNVEILSSYVCNGDTESHLACRKQIGEGELLYLNVYPLISLLENSNNQTERSTIYLLLGSILEISNIEMRSDGTPLQDVHYIFERAELSGNITFSAEAFLVPQEITRSCMMRDKGKEMFHNFTFTIEDFEELCVSLESAEIMEGGGAYTKITVDGNVTIDFVGQNSIAARSTEGEMMLNNVTQIILYPERSLQIYALLPRFQVKGHTILEKEGRQTKSDCIHFKGEVNFSTFYSDAFTMSNSFKGQFTSEIAKMTG